MFIYVIIFISTENGIAQILLLFLNKMLLFTIQFNSRWILKLINGISNDLQKLLNYFSELTIFVFFIKLFLLLTAFAVFPTRAALYLNNLELKMPLLRLKLTLLAGSPSNLNYRKIPDVSE